MGQQNLQGNSTQAQMPGVCRAAEPAQYSLKTRHQKQLAGWGSPGCRVQHSVICRWE